MDAEKKKFNLQERLINYSVLIIKIVDGTSATKAGNHLAGQLVRSGTAPALHYGEAQSAESRSDFIHKMKVALKELRETDVNLRTMHAATLFSSEKILIDGIKETSELISIFVKSIETARKNLKAETS